jgi:cyclase
MSKCEWCTIERVTEGVYAVIDRDGGWFRNNSGLIDMGSYTLIVDTQYNKRRTRDLLNLVAELNLPKPGLVVNTHHHGDHVWGNHMVGVPSIMQENAANMVEVLLPYGAELYKQFFPQLDFAGSKYSRAWIIFENQLTIRGDTRSVRVEFYGPAHTVGDAIIIVDDVVFTGDLVFNKVTPLALDGTVTGWLSALRKLQEEHKGKTLVPGHGPPADDSVVNIIEEYFNHLLDSAREMVSAGIDVLEAALKFGNGPLEGWSDGERLVLNLHRAMLDLRGEPPGTPLQDLPGLAEKMIKYVFYKRKNS